MSLHTLGGGPHALYTAATVVGRPVHGAALVGRHGLFTALTVGACALLCTGSVHRHDRRWFGGRTGARRARHVLGGARPRPDARPGSARGGLRVEVVTDPGQLAALRDDWTAAAAADATPNVYVTWEWVHTWWTHFGAGAELHVVVLRDADGIVAVAPLQRSRVGPGPLGTGVLERISPVHGDYGGVVVARREREAVEALADHLAGELRRREAAVAVLSRLASDDPFLWSLRRSLGDRASSLDAREVRLHDACLWTDLSEGFDLARQAKRHRIRQRLERLGREHGDVAVTEHSGPGLGVGLDRLVRVHAQRWSGRKEDVQGLLARPETTAFLLDAVRALDGRGWVKLLTLTASGRTVAAELDFAYRGRLFMFKGAFDPAFGPFGPGQLLLHRAYGDAVESGIELVDLGRGDAPYKRKWANGERYLVTVTLTRAGVGGRLADQRLRATRALTRCRNRHRT